MVKLSAVALFAAFYYGTVEAFTARHTQSRSFGVSLKMVGLECNVIMFRFWMNLGRLTIVVPHRTVCEEDTMVGITEAESFVSLAYIILQKHDTIASHSLSLPYLLSSSRVLRLQI
jgi:hypothetical protein